MARTNVKGTQVLDGSIGRADLNTANSGNAVITKVIGSNGLAIASSSGADSGTGDVTLAADLNFLNGKYPSLEVARTQNYVFAGPSSGSGNPAFRALVAGDIPVIAISGVTGLQTALDSKISGSGTSGYLAKYTGSLSHGNSIMYDSGSGIGIGTSAPNAPLQFQSNLVNRKIVLYEQVNNDHQYIGFGVNAGTVRYQSNGSGTAHVFYAASGASTSNELFRITGAGNIGIGNASPAYKLDVSGTGHFSGDVTFDLNAVLTTAPTTGNHLTNKSYVDGKVWAISAVTSLQSTLDAKISGSGTSGYLAKYNGSLTQGNSLIFENSGNIGIGTTSPYVRTQISGTTTGVNGMTAGSPAGVVFTVSNLNNAYGLNMGVYSNGMSWIQAARLDGTATTYNLALQAAGGFVGINTTSPSTVFNVEASIAGNYATNIRNNDNGASSNGLRVEVANNSSNNTVQRWYVAGSEIMRVQANGNVGIGTAIPASNFHISQSTTGMGTVSNSAGGTIVAGVDTQFLNTFRIGDSITINGETVVINAIASNTSMTTTPIANTNNGVAYTLSGGSRFVVRGNGNVGIGFTNPSQRLAVNGGILWGANDEGLLAYNSNASANVRAAASRDLRLQSNGGVNEITLLSNGNVGINTTTPTYKLDVNGTGRFVGNVIFDAIPSTPIAATSANHLVNYATMQAYISGIKYDSVKVKTVALSNITLSGHQSISGYTTSGSDRVLVMGQSTASQNGVYISNSSTWTRDTNFDTETEIKGFIHSVENGSYAGYKYINTNTGTITLGTTSITYVEFSSLLETDPVFTASVAYGINSTNISNWNDAYTNRISTKNTGDLAEGSNLYFTTTRVLDTLLTGYSSGTDTALASTDKIIDAFKKVQGQINNRLAIGGNTTGAAITIGTNDNFDFNLERNNAVQMAIKSGVIEANYDFDIKGKLKLDGSTGLDHQFVKYNGTATVWSTLDTGELSDKNNIVMLDTVNGERGFQMFADTTKAYAESFLYTNPDAGVSLGLHGYALDSSDTIKEFGMQLDTNGLLYHKKLDGTRSQIATVDMITGGSTTNVDGSTLYKGLNYQTTANSFSKSTYSYANYSQTTEMYMGLSPFSSSPYVWTAGISMNIVAPNDTSMNVGTLGSGRLSLYGNFVQINDVDLAFIKTSSISSLSGARCVIRVTPLGAGYRLTLEQE